MELDTISGNLDEYCPVTEARTLYENRGVNVKRFLLAIVSMGRFGVDSIPLPNSWLKCLLDIREQAVTP